MSNMAASTPKRKSEVDGDIRILCVGLADVDMITVVERYPEEDSDQRCVRARQDTSIIKARYKHSLHSSLS